MIGKWHYHFQTWLDNKSDVTFQSFKLIVKSSMIFKLDNKIEWLKSDINLIFNSSLKDWCHFSIIQSYCPVYWYHFSCNQSLLFPFPSIKDVYHECFLKSRLSIKNIWPLLAEVSFSIPLGGFRGRSNKTGSLTWYPTKFLLFSILFFNVLCSSKVRICLLLFPFLLSLSLSLMSKSP